MKNEKLANALNHVEDLYLADAAQPPQRRRPYWIGAIAAVLALVITVSLFPGISSDPNTPTDPYLENPTGNIMDPIIPSDSTEKPVPVLPATPPNYHNLVAAPTLPELLKYPNSSDYSDSKAYTAAYNAWWANQRAQYGQPDGYADSLSAFFHKSAGQFLSGKKNSVYSPLSIYMALAMLAETTGGNSCQQILDLFDLDSIEQLRTQVNHVWNAHYCADGRSDLLLANSLWLDNAYTFRQNAVQSLSGNYYASVFHGDLGSKDMTDQLHQWLNHNTGNLLSDQVQDLSMSQETVFALASTVYFAARWDAQFSKAKTENAIFHAEAGDRTVPFMHRSAYGDAYYWGSNFSAIRLKLSGDQHMWLILPDEGTTVAQVLASDEYLKMTRNPSKWEQVQYNSIIHMSVPKFDVCSDLDLIEGLRNLGITDAFDPSVSDFSPLTDTPWLFVNQIKHAARVAIDEEGCVGAAYTVEMVAGAAPPEGEITMVLDRPFLFVVSGPDHLPIFTGVVAEP